MTAEWAYINAERTVVRKILGPDKYQDALMHDPEIVAWLEAGNVPDPYVQPQLLATPKVFGE